MNVIVSTKLDESNYMQFSLTDSLKKVRDEFDCASIEALIFHTSIEKDFEVGVFISELRNVGISKFIYVNEDPSHIVKMVFQGVNGVFMEYEDCLYDEDELLTIVESYSDFNTSTSTSLANSSIHVVSEFIKAFARGENRIKAPIYLEQVSSAIEQLVEVNQMQELQISTMGMSAVSVFEMASQIIRQMNEKRLSLEHQLVELEAVQSSASTSRTLDNNLVYWQPYRNMSNSKIFLVREYAPCKYLTTFLMGYMKYLQTERNKRVKFIICRGRSYGESARYDNGMFTYIDKNNANNLDLLENSMIVTDSPKKDLLSSIFAKREDLFIVLDRLYGKADIITGRLAGKLNAVSSYNCAERNKLDVKDCIFSVTGHADAAININTFKDFPNDADTRYAYYNQKFGGSYHALDTRLKL